MFKHISKRVRRLDRLAWGLVVLPTVLAAGYFGLLASDVYVSESRFVVRSPERKVASPLGAVLAGVGFSKAQDDSFSVRDFILSRDALQVLNRQIGLGEAYASPEVDRLNRFAGLDPDNSFEALYRYYQGKVGVVTDSSSGITTLTVRAFSAHHAVDANRLLLEQSEALVNRLNERGRKDLVEYARQEVTQAQEKAKDAALALAQYRTRQSVLDPEKQAASQLTQVAKLQDELTATRMQLSQLRALTPRNPQLPSMEARVRTLETEIARETARVTGEGNSLTQKSADFQRLALEADFAAKNMASALAGYENALSEAQRQQVYLERIAQPSKPDRAQEPRRLRSVFITFLLGLVVYGIASMVIAGVREHMD
jgi:capsular polysaccharide transport system permease protein